MKKLILCVTTGLAAAFGTQYFYDTKLDPELAFFRRTAEVSDAWAAKVRADGRPVYIFAGGSDVRMGIDPAVMLEDGVLAINAGNNASMGMYSNTAIALSYARKGDTLVLCTYCNKMPEYDLNANGLKLNFQRRGWNMFRDGLTPLTPRVVNDLFRGVAGNWCVYASKKLFRPDQMFKYDKDAVVHESGWVEVTTRKIEADVPQKHFCPYHDTIPDLTQGNPEFMDYIHKVKRICDKKGVKLVVYFPRRLETPCDCSKAIFTMFALCYTRLGIPVVKDYTFGLEYDHRLFADDPLHLTPEGARHNSKIIAEALAASNEADRYWTEAELTDNIHILGWNTDGTPILHEEAGRQNQPAQK